MIVMVLFGRLFSLGRRVAVHVIAMMIVSRKNPNRPNDNRNRCKKSKKRIAYLNRSAVAFTHVHEQEQLDSSLDKRESEDNPKFGRDTKFCPKYDRKSD